MGNIRPRILHSASSFVYRQTVHYSCESINQAVTAAPPDQLATLTQINGDDLLRAFGLDDLRYGRAALLWLFRRPARRFARQVIAYDECVGRAGLQAGGEWMLRQLVPGALVEGVANVPTTGPLLIVANHPGLYDTTALFSAITRTDLCVIAADRPFLRALPHTARHLLMIGDEANDRTRILRAATRHMRSGGALLLCPAGKIEPDPALFPDAVNHLDQWSESIELFARLVPSLTIVPAVISHVLSPHALRHPLAKLRRTSADQQWLAATLQLIFPSLKRDAVRVAFGAPLQRDGAPVSALLLADVRRIMQRAYAAAQQ